MVIFFYTKKTAIILTDITYLYYGEDRELFYLCVFKDAFTTEILGYALDTQITVDLVKKAYENMMDKHRDEFKKNVEYYIHSDQGSQYLACNYMQMIKNNGFIQSMSERGNS